MNEVLPLINAERIFVLWFDSPSLNKFLTEFSPSCIDERFDESSACGVYFQVYEQRQPNGRFESNDKLTIAEGTAWMNENDVYGLKIYLTTCGTDGELWKKISWEIDNILRRKDEAWESFKEKIAEIKKRRRLNAKIILTELNRTNEMSQVLKKAIANKLDSWERLVKEIKNSREEELQKNCVCLELKKDDNGKMYFDYQKYKNYQPRENGDDSKWKIYLKEEHKAGSKDQVIYFEKFDKAQEKNENSAVLTPNNKNKMENSIHGKNENSNIANEIQNDTKKNESDTSNNRNGLNEIKYEQQNMKKDKKKNRNIEKDNSIDDKNKNENPNNRQSENGKDVELKIKDKNKSEIKCENPNNRQSESDKDVELKIKDKNKSEIKYENPNKRQSENDKDVELKIKDKNKSEIKCENPNNKQVTNFRRKPTILWIILAIIFSPTVILSIIFIGLAIRSHKFNCKLKKNALQILKNNGQENPESNQDKNHKQQIPAMGIDCELDKQNNL